MALRIAKVGAAVTGSGFAFHAPSVCEKDKEFPKFPESFSDAQKALVEVSKSMTEIEFFPMASSLSFGGIAGFCSGIFVKKGFRAAVGTAGGLFVLFQVAHSQGYVDIHLEKIEKDVMKIIDTNNDGKIDQQDARLYLNRTVSLLTHDTKLSAGGFTIGFMAGFKKG